MNRAALAIITVIAMSSAAPQATAAVPEILRPGTHPMWASLSLGPAINVHEAPGQFKLIQTFGYHFSGTAEGPAIAFDLQESFGDHWTMIELGPKFVWDIPLIPDMGLYLSPSGMFGFAHGSFSWSGPFGASGDFSANGFTLQLGIEGKLIIADRGLVFFRPLTIDILGLSPENGDFNTSVRYDMMFGGGVIF